MLRCYTNQIEDRKNKEHNKSKGYLLLPDGRELLGPLIVAGKAVDPALYQDQPELGILVFSIPLEVLPDCHRLLDQVVQIFRNLRRKP